jgi:hypothetical protein
MRLNPKVNDWKRARVAAHGSQRPMSLWLVAVTGRFGSFQSTSRAGRALAILHEVAHMIVIGSYTNSRGRRVRLFLIPPEEGGVESDAMSQMNSSIVEAACRNQLLALGAN